MTFQEAVESVAEIRDAYRNGLQALEDRDKQRLHSPRPQALSGSVYIDQTLRRLYPDAPRWDYGIGIASGGQNEKVFWIEVHPASSGHVDDTIQKYVWLKNWLQESAHALQQLTTANGVFVWVASGKVAFSKNSPQYRRVAAAGIKFAGERFTLT